MAKRNALGRGLGALIDDADQVREATSVSNEVELSKIQANPFQPRTTFDEEALEELATSIREIGIIQPLTLRKLNDEQYQIIAGERRFRAAKIAGLDKVPAFVREAGDEEMLELALVENIQREDLDAIEVALSYQRLIEECDLTQESLSERVGKKRSTVSNYLRLLRLPAVIQKGIREQEISMGHARALVNIAEPETQVMIFKQIVKYDFSVRKVEEIVRKINSDDGEGSAKPKKTQSFPEEYGELKTHLSKYFNTSVDFKINDKGKGKIVIPFTDPKELERIIGIFDRLNS
ncbi:MULTISPECIES: ParB/RepB/Spo0J family partition protein [Prolixibacter]|uniref:Chromosome partitioning protein ParB n=1 Tax=Prolixibacter denitrificans TaxID=1541063 RepID=A0A2P8CK29_9BACT|nr:MULTISPECIES: ParB/RepB/Spo0J family partition protein [Prolixibacter]PSK85328.1 ParB family chromosome partitioning protein [Prolixibacter denitrificans]GET19948.1 chromosome partitioning protein ParB [Prolixibacter denitrificans]GET26625.1 chromosome partitioning protein ParB [Prolixibacter sp. NT017]